MPQPKDERMFERGDMVRLKEDPVDPEGNPPRVRAGALGTIVAVSSTPFLTYRVDVQVGDAVLPVLVTGKEIERVSRPSARHVRTRLENDGSLEALARQAMAAFSALPPDERAAHRREQAISWVYGELGLAGREDVTKEQIAELIDRLG